MKKLSLETIPREPWPAPGECRTSIRTGFTGKMLGLLYRPDIKDKARILFFSGRLQQQEGCGFEGFAENMENSSEDRRTAVYVMGKCPDKLDFAEFLQN